MLLSSLTRDCKALEFGALDRPMINKKDYSVKYVDFTDREDLAMRLSNESAVAIANLVEVDIVWNADRLEEALGEHQPVDFVLASHVFEHLPNPLGWLETLRPILSNKGRISLAIPDKRFTFDRERPETRVSEWVAAKLENRSIPPIHLALEAVMYFSPIDSSQVWQLNAARRKLLAPTEFERYLDLAKGVLSNGTYHDVHCSIFTPESFVELMLESAYYGLHDYAFSTFVPTRQGDMEFFVELTVCDSRQQQLSDWSKLSAQLA